MWWKRRFLSLWNSLSGEESDVQIPLPLPSELRGRRAGRRSLRWQRGRGRVWQVKERDYALAAKETEGAGKPSPLHAIFLVWDTVIFFYLRRSQPQVYKLSFFSLSSFSHPQIMPSINHDDHMKYIYWLHQGYLVQFNQTLSYLINLDRTRSNWIKLDQTWSILNKLDQTGPNWIKLDKTWLNLIKLDSTNADHFSNFASGPLDELTILFPSQITEDDTILPGSDGKIVAWVDEDWKMS